MKHLNFYIINQNEEVVSILSSDKNGEHTAILNAIVEEKLTSYDILTLKIPADSEDAKLINEDYTIVFQDIKGWREYSITIIEDIDGDSIITTISAELSSIELIDEIMEAELSGMYLDPEELLTHVLSNTRWSVGVVDASLYKQRYNENTEYKTVLEVLNDISSFYKAEVQFSYQVQGNKVIKRFVNLYRQFGENKGKRFEVDKDISSISRTVDITNIKTAIVPYFYTQTEAEEGEESEEVKVDISDVVWSKANGDPVDKPKGQTYLADPNALELWGKKNPNGTKRHRYISMEINVTSAESLISMAWVQLGRYTVPKTTYEVKAVDLYTLTGDEDLKHEYANLGDTVVAVDKYLSKPIQVVTRVVEIKRDLLDPINNEFVFGDSKSIFSTRDVEEKIENVADSIGSIKENIDKINKKFSNIQSNLNGKNNVFRGSATPVNMIENDIWFRPHPTKIGEKQMLVYNGSIWEIQADSYDLADASRLKFGIIDAIEVNVINLTADDINGGRLNLAEGLVIGAGSRDVLKVNAQTGEIEMNISKLTINASPAISQDDLNKVISENITTIDDEMYPLFTDKAHNNSVVHPTIYGKSENYANLSEDSPHEGRLISVPLEIVSSKEYNQEDLLSNYNNVKTLTKKWADDYLLFLDHNTKDTGNIAINSLGLVGGSFVTDDPITTYTPPTAGTSEGQLLVIRGLLRNYIQTRDQKWLIKAEKLTEALLKYYYPSETIPQEPDETWIPHWLVNVTEPFTSREYFLNGEVDFVNGVGVATFNKIFRVFTARSLDSTLEYSWSPEAPIIGTKYEIENTVVEYGNSRATIHLKDKNFTGKALITYTSETGRTIEIGEKCEAFPVWRPLDEGEIACAVDALPWALDVFDLWYQIEGDEKWLRAIESTKEALRVVSDVSNTKYYIKKGNQGDEVLANGITSFSTRNPVETYTNTGEMILIDYKESSGNDEASIGTWVGNRVEFKDKQWIEIKLSSDKSKKITMYLDEDGVYDPNKRWVSDFYTNGSGLTSMQIVSLSRKDFYKTDRIIWGIHYNKSSDGGAINSANSSVEKADILDGNKQVSKITFTRGDEGGWLGWAQFMFSIWGTKLPFSIKYKTASEIDFVVNDSAGVKHTYRLPKTGSSYQTIELKESMFTGGTFDTGKYQSMLLESVDSTSQISIEYLGYKEVMDKNYYTSISLSYSGQDALKIGLEYIKPAPSRTPLPYAPYIFPFDMHLINYKVSNLRGAIYTGYQVPWVFQDGLFPDIDKAVDTNLQFLLDSQVAYNQLTGVKGFFAPIFWWDYENDYGENEPNTFGIQGNWGEVWGGFQYRTISDVARVFEKEPSNVKAFNIFIDFITAMDKYWVNTAHGFPTVFIAERPPYNNQTDSHMVTNFMRALLYGLKSTSLTNNHKQLIVKLISKCMDYLRYWQIPVGNFDSEVEGTFSPNPSQNVWYSYWGGDILDALAIIQGADFSSVSNIIDDEYKFGDSTVVYDVLIDDTYITKIEGHADLRGVGDSRDKLFSDSTGTWRIERNVKSLTWNGTSAIQRKSFGDNVLHYMLTPDKKIGTKYLSSKYPYSNKTAITSSGGELVNPTANEAEFVGVLLPKNEALALPLEFHYQLDNTVSEVISEDNQTKLSHIPSFKNSSFVYTINYKNKLGYSVSPLISGSFKTLAWYTAFRLKETKKQLEGKADSDALTGLIDEVGGIRTDLSNTPTIGDLEQLEAEFKANEEQRKQDKEQAENNLKSIDARTAIIENNFGEYAEEWKFVRTSIRMADEGIKIGNVDKKTNVLVSDDRISFFNNGNEVAFISDNQLQINQGTFLKNMRVGAHQIDSLANNNDVTVVRWVGLP